MKKILIISLTVLLISPTLGQDVNDVLNKLDEIQKELDSLKVKDSKEILFSVGGNVNFLDEARLNGLYYDIDVFLPELWKKTNALKRFGIEARFAQGRLDIGKDTLATNIMRTFRVNDTVGVRQSYQVISTEESNYLNLSLNPTYALGKDDNLFLVAFFEYFRRTNNREFATAVQDQDTVSVGSESLSMTPRTNSTSTSEEVFDLFNYGIGFKLYHKIGKNLILNIRPVIGVGTFAGNRDFFYHTRFEVIEANKGFKFGGEIRGLVGTPDDERPSQGMTDLYNPFVNIYIAKTFGFNALGKFLLGD